MAAWAVAFPGATIAALIAQGPARYVTERVVRWLDGVPANP